MLFHPVLSPFVEQLFDQPAVLPVLGVGMAVFVKWLLWTLDGSGSRPGASR